jgi:hypothetical protein
VDVIVAPRKVSGDEARCDVKVKIDSDQRSDLEVGKIARYNFKSSQSQNSELDRPVRENNADGGSKVSAPMDSQKLDAEDLKANLKIWPRQLTIRKKKRLTSGKLDGKVISQKKVNHIKIYQFNTTMGKTNFGEMSNSKISTKRSRLLSGLAINSAQKNIDQAFNLGELEGVNKNQYIPERESSQDHPLGIRP